MQIPSKTQEELYQIALDLYKGLIFTDRHVTDPEDLRMVFMVFIFMKSEDIEELKANPPGMIYEYLSEAGPVGINGLPSFFSCRMLTTEDVKIVLEKYDAIDKALDSVKNLEVENTIENKNSRVPTNFTYCGLEMSNFDHTIDPEMEEKLMCQQVYGRHAAYNFNGKVWFNDNSFFEEVWRYDSLVDVLSDKNLERLMKKVNDRYGYE